MQHIAKSDDQTRGCDILDVARRCVPVLIFPLMLASCMGGSMGFLDPTPVDRTLTTGSIQTRNAPDSISDELTVRNAVSSADLTKLGTTPLPWANSSTGSAGVIRDVSETHEGPVLCRDFSTSRHSYDGIANFIGKTCLIGNGQWQLLNFQQHG